MNNDKLRPAFPVPGWKDDEYFNGLTMRDWYASHAPACPENYLQQQRVIDRTKNPYNESHKPKIREDLEIIATWNFAYADAMLAERSKS